MKTFLTKAALLLVASLAAVTFVSCSDDDGGSSDINELKGSYALTTVPKDNGAGAMNNLCLTIDPTWTVTDWSDKNSDRPMFDASPIMGYPAGSMVMTIKDLVVFVEPMLANFVKKALVSLDLKEDGSFSATYHDFISQGNMAQDFMQPQFATETSTFPNGVSDVLPADALSYFTDSRSKLVYFAVSKGFIRSMDETLIEMIDGMLAKNKNLPILSNEQVYALPLKYEITTEHVKVYLDRATLKPFAPLLPLLLGMAGGNEALGGLDVADLVDKLLDNTSALEICLYLKRI